LSDDKLLDHHADDFTHLLICIDLHEHRVLTTQQLGGRQADGLSIGLAPSLKTLSQGVLLPYLRSRAAF
jgi:hypothetical protein